MNELVTIMIPAYNAERYIGKCLESLIRQTYENIEIVIVNDGSTDGTSQICEEYRNRDSRIRIIDQVNAGEGAARNRGLLEARGQFLCFVDADDTVEKDFIEHFVSLQQEHQTGLTICGFVEHRGDEVINQTSGDVQILNQEQAMEKLLREDSFKGYVWNKMFDLSIIREHSLQFDTSLAVWTDVLFVFQYLQYTDKTVFDPRPKYRYRYVETSASHMANHLLGVEKSYSAIRAKEQMVDRIPVGYESVQKQLQVRFVQSALAVIRNIGYMGLDDEAQHYLQNSISYLRKYRKQVKKDISKKERILVLISCMDVKLLLRLYCLFRGRADHLLICP